MLAEPFHYSQRFHRLGTESAVSIAPRRERSEDTPRYRLTIDFANDHVILF